MNVNIRLADNEDIPAICRIISQLTPGLPHDYLDAVDKFDYAIKHNADYYLWVATIDLNPRPRTGAFTYMATYKPNVQVVGTAMMHLQHKLSYNCGTAAHLEDVVVDQKYRGQGIGELLVKTAIKTAKAFDCYKLMLTCFEKTVPYYRQFGFNRHDVGMKLVLKEEYPNAPLFQEEPIKEGLVLRHSLGEI